MPKEGELAHQNIRDRYAGKDDPVAAKMLRRVEPGAAPEPPADKSLTTIWVGGIDETTTEAELR
jgi:pre-mRNA-splicing factor RBM22/SLT11